MAINYINLLNEIINDPLILGYNGKSDSEIADIMNSLTTGRTLSRDFIETWEIIEATVPAEWSALTTGEKQRYQTIISAGRLNIKGNNIRSQLSAMFGVGTATRTNLQALQTIAGSRAEELFGAALTHLDIAKALRG